MPKVHDPYETRRLGGAILVLAAVAFAATVVLPRIDFTRPARHHFDVPLDRGVGSLSTDSRVLLAGVSIGRVTSTDPSRSSDGRVDVVRVEIAVDPEIPLGRGTAAQLVSPVIGTGTDVRLLPSPGTRLQDGAALEWVPPPDFLERVFGADDAAAIRRLSRNLESVRDWSADHGSEVTAEIASIREDLEALRSLTRPNSATWIPTLRSVQGDVAESRERLGRLEAAFGAFRASWDRLKASFTDARTAWSAALPVGGGVFNELRLLERAPSIEPIETSTNAILEAWGRLEPRWLTLISRLADLISTIERRLPNTAANVALAAGQFTGLLDDLESDPIPAAGQALGVLLGMVPSEGRRIQIERAEALRGYVRAMGDLQRALNAIERAAVEAGDPTPARAAAIEADLLEALRRLRDAEQAAIRVWAPAP